MPPVPPGKPRSCVEILARLGDKPTWDDYLARIAAAAEEETGPDVAMSPADRAAVEAHEASQIAELRRRLGLD